MYKHTSNELGLNLGSTINGGALAPTVIFLFKFLTFQYSTQMTIQSEETLSRNEFLKNLGFKGAALVALYCSGNALTSCKSDGTDVTPLATDIVIDLSATTSAALTKANGYIISNNVVIARTSASATYAAATIVCSHEARNEVIYKSGEFFCTAHGARFTNAGVGLNTEGKAGLKVYQVSVSGNTLTVKAA